MAHHDGAAMNYRSVADMNEDVKAWASRLPRDVDLVVGIPRSGLLAASMLSLHLNVPLTDLDGFLEDRLLAAGERLNGVDTADPRRVLVVDDSVLTGSAMTEARERVASADVPAERLLFGAVYELTGNLVLVMLLHGIGNWWPLLVDPGRGAWPNYLVILVVYAVLVWLYRTARIPGVGDASPQAA